MLKISSLVWLLRSLPSCATIAIQHALPERASSRFRILPATVLGQIAVCCEGTHIACLLVSLLLLLLLGHFSPHTCTAKQQTKHDWTHNAQEDAEGQTTRQEGQEDYPSSHEFKKDNRVTRHRWAKSSVEERCRSPRQTARVQPPSHDEREV